MCASAGCHQWGLQAGPVQKKQEKKRWEKGKTGGVGVGKRGEKNIGNYLKT